MNGLSPIFVSFAALVSGMPNNSFVNNISSQYNEDIIENTLPSGNINSYLSENMTFERECTTEQGMTKEMKDIAKRYSSLMQIFNKNSPGDFSIVEVFENMANILCKIPFLSNVSYFNEDDESIDIRLKLNFGIYVSLSRFMDEEDDNVVFSIHRGTDLLVANEMPLCKLENNLCELLSELQHKNA